MGSPRHLGDTTPHPANRPDDEADIEQVDGMGRIHVPVLFQEILHHLQVKPGGRYIDATVGAGGHALGILQASSPHGRLLGLDRDPAAIAMARQRLDDFADRVDLVCRSYVHLAEVAQARGFVSVDGILFDLGLSSLQLDDAHRGFSFMREGPLDMRFNPQARDSTAADIVNTLPADELASLLYRYGGERRSHRIARAIVAARPLRTTTALADVIEQAVGGRSSRGRIHPATQTFQALRIAVNDELAALEAVLPQAVDGLAPGGRLAVISFHSLEDRIVKNYFRRESRDCVCPPGLPICMCDHRARLRRVNRKLIRPTEEEVSRNARARSARLRVAERLPAKREEEA